MQAPSRSAVDGDQVGGSTRPIDALLEAVRVVTAQEQESTPLSPTGDLSSLRRGIAPFDPDHASKKAPVRRGRRCKGCARWKVRCSDQLPCERCFTMCVPCEPQCLAKGQPFVELAITTINPEHMNVQFLQAFNKLHAAGNINRPLLMRRLLMWRAMSLRVQQDVTHGLFGEICHALRISIRELEALDEQISAGQSRLKDEEIPSLHAAMSRQIEHSDTFMQLDDGVSMVMVAVACETGVVWAMNKVAGDKFCTAQEGNSYLRFYAMLPMHIIASMIAPDDRMDYYDLELAAYSTAPQTGRTGFVKFCERSGQIELYLLRMRFIEMPEFPDAHLISVLTLELAPTSRHITRRPGHHHYIVESFRQGATQNIVETASVGPSMRSSMSANGGPSSSPAMPLPGVACVALPPPPHERVHELFTSAIKMPPTQVPITQLIARPLPPPPQHTPRLLLLPPSSSVPSSSSSSPAAAAPKPPSSASAATHSLPPPSSSTSPRRLPPPPSLPPPPPLADTGSSNSTATTVSTEPPSSVCGHTHVQTTHAHAHTQPRAKGGGKGGGGGEKGREGLTGASAMMPFVT